MVCETIKNGNVILVEPNCVNTNNNITNGIPQYQDMYIFAELVAKSRGRTMIIDGETTTSDSKIINFIGNNQDNDNPNNPNYLRFTTNYYDGSNPDGKYYEGFGIEGIKIVINSSFVPQISIRFVDVRGLAFFNQKNSPYRILFDFPPPTFTLTVKGYYGKPVVYDLHLVKYSTEFSAGNGNFIIDAQFVALTFAPLSDILFRYVVNTALINGDTSMNPEGGEKPRNTCELILKLKNLYKAVSDKIQTDTESIEYNNTLKSIEQINEIFDVIRFYADNEKLTKPGTPHLVARIPAQVDYVTYPPTDSVPNDELVIITNLSEYDTMIKEEQSSGTNETPKKRIYILYEVATNVNVTANTSTFNYVPTYYEYDTLNNSGFETALNNYKQLLLGQKIPLINFVATDIKEPRSFLNSFDIQELRTFNDTYVKYYGLDITDYYYKLYKNRDTLELARNKLALDIITKINNMIAERLGMIPSIYNVFEIILNDVDKFFSLLKSTADDAYDSHNNIPANKQLILGDGAYKDNTTNVYPFPLVIRTYSDREERVAPIELSKKVPFPELDFVQDFIDTFLLEERYKDQINVKEDENDQGEKAWIPISPLDSTLGNAITESPFIRVSDDVTTEILKIVLKRFYMLSQGFISDAFYAQADKISVIEKENIARSEAYVKLFAETEALNLILASKTSETILNTLQVMSDKYFNSPDIFYKDISGITDTYNDGNSLKTGYLYSFPKYDPKYFPINPNVPSEGHVFTNKNNPNFEGIILSNSNIQARDVKNNSTSPIDLFYNDVNIKGTLFKVLPEKYFDFSLENTFFIRDKTIKEKVNVVDDGGEIQIFTRFLSQASYQNLRRPNDYVSWDSYARTQYTYNYPGINTVNVVSPQHNIVERQLWAYSGGTSGNNIIPGGNSTFRVDRGSLFSLFNITIMEGADFIDTFSLQLARYDSLVMPTISADTKMGSLLILSCFGYATSPFNTFPNGLNSLIFDTPAAIEVPKFYPAYIGALLDAIENGWEISVIDYFTKYHGKYLDNAGFFIFADLHDVKLYLSENDKTIFKNAYNSYILEDHINIVNELKRMYEFNYKYSHQGASNWDTYKFYMNPNASDNKKITGGTKGFFFQGIVRPLMERTNIINYNQLTFKSTTDYNSGYISLKTMNDGIIDGNKTTTYKTINDKYFKIFFTKINALVGQAKEKAKEEKKELEKLKGDPDIINQLYYSFKNINDKWLSGTAKGKQNYPFLLSNNSRLIDLFSFVDRGMNPIGETIINCEILADMLEDDNISLYTALSQLLSTNGFEFFPLQNFLNFDNEKSWEDSFKIHTGGYSDAQRTFFVCMYIGGSSSYPSVSANGFVEDGIIDISAPGVKGFSPVENKTEFEENINQEKNIDFPWRQVRAFRVRFGEQNQSMFTDIKIDSKEYPETNESIQILSRLAGDNNPGAPAPKGQNLYNLYENRSYKASVTGFGNMMIQPTQYFQVENVPLFNGAYVILEVEHNISPNNMTTTFSGTKLLKYPVPRVITPFAFANMDDMSGGEATTYALRMATQAAMMSEERLNYLKSVLGVDVSHHNGNVNWQQANAGGVKFAFMKLTQGPSWYDGNAKNYDIAKNIKDAISNGITLSYYHFAHLGETSSPSADGVANANNFLTRLNNLIMNYSIPKPKMPIVLDVEWDCFVDKSKKYKKTYLWNNKDSDINTFISSFINTMKTNGYDVIIYSAKSFIEEYKINQFGKYPLWLAHYFTLPKLSPETNEPPLPKEWTGWTAWQFSSQGIVDGVRGRVDLNAMKSDFFNKFA